MSDDLIRRLRGQYSMGPHVPNGNPEFGWRQFQAPPIQHEAAGEIKRLRDQADVREELIDSQKRLIESLRGNADQYKALYYKADKQLWEARGKLHGFSVDPVARLAPPEPFEGAAPDRPSLLARIWAWGNQPMTYGSLYAGFAFVGVSLLFGMLATLLVFFNSGS